MKVIEFLEVCPPDHDITIFWTQICEEFFMPNKNEPFYRFGIFYAQVMEAEIAFVHAENLKSFYITTKD